MEKWARHRQECALRGNGEDHNNVIWQRYRPCRQFYLFEERAMNNFDLHTPTRILFGKGAIEKLREQIPADARVLITYGGGSVKKPACWIRY
jgi:NADP-dependent alcohol dehydrogenase